MCSSFRLSERCEAYHNDDANLSDAEAFDYFRRFVFGEGWSQELEADQLAALKAAIAGMPDTILTINVSWVRAAFEESYGALMTYHR